MKTAEFVFDDYAGHWDIERIGCRAVVVRDGKMLLTYAVNEDAWMIPGGGIEPGETDEECCIRETEEETGVIVLPGECFLEIVEYFENYRWVSRYFTCTVTGMGQRSLTEPEKAEGLEVRWVPVEEIRTVFASYSAYTDTRRGLYRREYTALCEWENK